MLDDPDKATSHVEETPGNAVIFVGKMPIVSLGDADAEAAGGDVSLHVYAASVASKVDDALRAERTRAAIAEHVFSFSLLVFSGLLAFLLVRRVGDISGRLRAWVKAHPDRIPALKLGTIEVVRPVAVRGAVSIGLALAHRIAQFTIVYSWLIFALSRFEATRSYTDRLAGFVLVPLSALIGRVGSSLPLLVVAAIAAVAIGVAVRFVGLFFSSLARGETHVAWLPRDLAGPTSVLVRSGIVLVSIVLAAPLITGTDDGALSRAGVVALVALGLACHAGPRVRRGGGARRSTAATCASATSSKRVGAPASCATSRCSRSSSRTRSGAKCASRSCSASGTRCACSGARRSPRSRSSSTRPSGPPGSKRRSWARRWRPAIARASTSSRSTSTARAGVSPAVPKYGKGVAAVGDAVAQAIAERGIALGRRRPS